VVVPVVAVVSVDAVIAKSLYSGVSLAVIWPGLGAGTMSSCGAFIIAFVHFPRDDRRRARVVSACRWLISLFQIAQDTG